MAARNRAQDIAEIEAELDRAANPRQAMQEQFREANLTAARDALAAGHGALAVSVAPAWMPVPGTILEGTVFGIIKRAHPEFGDYPIIGVKCEKTGDPVAVHGLPQTLHDGLKTLKPQAGDPIVVAFLGERLSGSRETAGQATEYHLYAVSSPIAEIQPYQW